MWQYRCITIEILCRKSTNFLVSTSYTTTLLRIPSTDLLFVKRMSPQQTIPLCWLFKKYLNNWRCPLAFSNITLVLWFKYFIKPQVKHVSAFRVHSKSLYWYIVYYITLGNKNNKLGTMSPIQNMMLFCKQFFWLTIYTWVTLLMIPEPRTSSSAYICRLHESIFKYLFKHLQQKWLEWNVIFVIRINFWFIISAQKQKIWICSGSRKQIQGVSDKVVLGQYLVVSIVDN